MRKMFAIIVEYPTVIGQHGKIENVGLFVVRRSWRGGLLIHLHLR